MASDDKLSAEDRLIAEYFKPIATPPGALGLTDDAAFITPAPGTDVVLKTDAIIGGVHFFAEDDARDVARKALRVNLSDLAAKGATPLGFLVSLALPKDTGADWLKRFALGLRDDAEAYACPLFGGDTDQRALVGLGVLAQTEREALEPIGANVLRQSERDEEAERGRALGGEIGEIDPQRLARDVARVVFREEVHAADDGVGLEDDVGARRRREEGGVVGERQRARMRRDRLEVVRDQAILGRHFVVGSAHGITRR